MSWFFLDDERDEAQFLHCATVVSAGRFQTDHACIHAGRTRVRYEDDIYYANTVPLPGRMTADRGALLAAGAQACDWLSAQPWGPAPAPPPPYADRPDGVGAPRWVDYKLDLKDPSTDSAEHLSLQVAETAWHYLCFPELKVHRANAG